MGQKYTNISDLYKQVKLNEREIIERKLTSQELEDREKIAKKLPMDDFKKRYGKDAMAVKMATATNIVKKKSQNETIEDELGERTGKYSKMNLDKAKKLMGPSKNREQGVKMVMKGLGTTYKHANQLVDKILGVNPKTGKIESAELDEGKKRYNTTSNVGKAKYVINFHDGKKTNKDGSDFFDIKIFKNKPDFENAEKELKSKGYVKEEVELDEGYESEVLDVLSNADIDGYFKNNKLYISRRDASDAKKALEDADNITKLPKMVMEALDKEDEPKVKQIVKKLKKASQAHAGQATDLEKAISEDGHVDVASAIRQCKTITEDAMQMLQKLKGMSPEDSLPTWWTNKLAVASNSMNKMRDYLLVPSMSEKTDKNNK